MPMRRRRLDAAGDEARRDETAEAVPEQHERSVDVAANGVDDGREIGEQVVVAREPPASAGTAPMAALVVADDAPAVRIQARGDVGVAADVLAQPVDDDNRAPGPVGRPVVLEQVEAVAGPNRPAHRIHLTP